MRLKVYNGLYLHGPCTYSELFKCMAKGSERANYNVNTRLGELRDLGVVCEIGKKVCDITKQEVIVWDVTSKYPGELIRKPTKKQKVASIVKDLETLKGFISFYGSSVNEIIKKVKDL